MLRGILWLCLCPVTSYTKKVPVFKKGNRNFFKVWSSDMAYVLGFFAADGSMIKNKRGGCFIEFTSTDKILLSQIQTIFKSSHKISVRKSIKTKHKPLFRIQFGSKEMFNDLQKLGFSQNKSKKMKFPLLPKEFFADFVRGYFDGDGNVYFKQHHVKDRKNKKWIFSSRFTSGSKTFLISLHKELGKNEIKKGFIVQKERGFELVFSHKDSLALYQLMYHNAPVTGLYLPRKYKIFHQAIYTLYRLRS